MLTQIKLKFGSSPGSQPLVLNGTPITIFVGPNNSGKSLVLRELFQFCQNGKNANCHIFEELKFNENTDERVETIISKYRLTPNQNEFIHPGHLLFGKFQHRQQIPEQNLKQFLKIPSSNINAFAQHFLSFQSLLLDGSTRMNHIREIKGGNLQTPPQQALSILFRDNDKRKKLRDITYEAFRKYFVIDPTDLGKLKIRFSQTEPQNELVERGIHEDAVRFHGNAELINSLSDGVKAFTGILVEIIAGDPQLLFIDEPEAFLHPTLSFKLGLEVAKSASETGKNVFVSTHSSNFIMGCVQAGVEINIVRLTYHNNSATARNIPSAQLLELMKNPLFRSAGVLNGLFYNNVVVTEADSDRAFYQEINERKNLVDSSGIRDCLFLNAQNKQTVCQIIEPLRNIGIPAAAVVDVDVLKEGGNNWANLLKSGFVPEVSRHSLATARAEVKARFDQQQVDMKKDGGIYALVDDDQEAANNLLNQLSEYGIFVVKGGELESWLKSLNCENHGPKWLISIFEKLGKDPGDPEYLTPSKDDVWAFIHEIKQWMENEQRKGIPK